MLDTVTHRIGQLSALVAALAFAVLLVALGAQFTAREVLGIGLIGADELARLAFVWCALFGASAAWCDDALHRIDLLSRNCSGLAARLLGLLCQGLIAGVLCYLIFYGWRMSLRAWPQTTSSLEISGGWTYLALPIAAALMLVVCLIRAAQLATASTPTAPQNP